MSKTKELLKTIKDLKIKIDPNLLAEDASSDDYQIIGYNSAISDILKLLERDEKDWKIKHIDRIAGQIVVVKEHIPRKVPQSFGVKKK